MPDIYRKSRLLRRSRVLWGSFAVWKPRLVFWLGALAIGVISVGFAGLADFAQRVFRNVSTGYPWAVILTPLGFLVSAYIATKFFPNSQGSGIPQAIAARHLRDEGDRTYLLSLKVAVGKIALTVFGLLFGASIGREGPTVQVGASIMLAVARFGGVAHARGLILAGSAAGIAAAFNTPLAGIVFAIEEMSRTYESRANGLVLAGVIVSGLAALGLSGSYDYFGSTAVLPLTLQDWLLVPICGVLGGTLGAAFSGGALHYGQKIRQWVHTQPLKRTLIIAGLCGVGVAFIGYVSDGLTFGTSYEQARTAIEGAHLPELFFVEKLAASFLSMLSGIPGGIFAPSLSVGAGLGSTVGEVVGATAGLAAILGMAGYFSGVVQAPMTAFVIIIEMTGDHRAVIPIMATSLVGYVTSRILSREPLYHGLSRVFIAAVLRRNRVAKAAFPPGH